MKFILFSAFLFLVFKPSIAQSTDTLYYDRDWDQCTKDLAFYFGLKHLDEDYSGIENYHFISGEKQSRIERENGSRNGRATWWHKNGQKSSEGTYVNGIAEGVFTYWYPNGIKKEEGLYANDERTGEWKYYDKGGIRFYGTDVDKPTLFMNARNLKKSNKKLIKYLQANTNYPEIGEEKGIEGRVIIGFTIDEEGKVVDVEVEEGINHYLDQHAKKIISDLPKWTPAVKNGKNVRVRSKIPINFRFKD